MSTYFFIQQIFAADLLRTLVLVSLVTSWILLSSPLSANESRGNESTASEFLNPQNASNILDWQTFSQDIDLKNESRMRQYVAQTAIAGTLVKQQDHGEEILPARFQFVFYPRFQCSPLIKFIARLPASISSDRAIEIKKNYIVKDMDIDGEPVEYPSLVELREDLLHIVYNANLQRRTTLRILVELGDSMRVGFQNGSVLDFSLLGSQKTLESATADCRNH